MTSTFLVAYVAFPLLFAALAVGAGLLLAPLAPDRRLGALLAPMGATLLVAAGAVVTFFPWSARWTTPVFVLLAVAGAVMAGVHWWRIRADSTRSVDLWPVVVYVVAFILFAAPVAMSGQPTWAGWIKLDDTASWLGFTDWLMQNGKTLPDAMSSTYERLIDVNFRGTGAAPYPTGAFPPLGVVSQLTGTDIAWLIHPYMSALGGLLSLALYALLGRAIVTPWARAAAAILAGQAATLVGYVLWGGLKEILLPVLLAVLAVTATAAAAPGSRRRSVVLPVLAGIAFLSVTGTSGLGYVAPLALAAVLIGWHARRPRSMYVAAAALASAAVTGGVLVLAGALPSRFELVPTIPDIGNLVGPLNPWQSVGIWIGADFRFDPELPLLTAILVGVAALLAVLGVVVAVRSRDWSLPLFTGAATLVVVYSQFSGGDWLAGKAMAVASPAILAASFAGAGWLVRRSGIERIVGLAAAVAVAVGVLMSNGMAFRGVWLAPVDRAEELAAIGAEFAGQGPTLLPENATYAGRHFLRDMDAEVASGLRVNAIPLRDGTIGQKGQSFDIVAFPPATIEAYPILVLRRTPAGAVPPPNYARIWSGTYYDVWERIPGSPAVTGDVPLAGPYAVPEEAACRAIEALAAAAPSGTLLAAPAAEVVEVPLGAGAVPDGWTTVDGDPAVVVPTSPGALAVPVTVPADGVYEVWLGGSSAGRLTVSIDGDEVYAGGPLLEADATLPNSLGTVDLTAGRHEITIDVRMPWWLPGAAAGPFPMGPVYLTRPDADRTPFEVPAAQASTLCGRDLDWVSVS